MGQAHLTYKSYRNIFNILYGHEIVREMYDITALVRFSRIKEQNLEQYDYITIQSL